MFLSSMAQQATSAHNLWAQQMANMFGGIFPFANKPPESQAASEPPAEAKSEEDRLRTLEELRERLDVLLAAKEESEKKKS
jgi:hypothetical protein